MKFNWKHISVHLLFWVLYLIVWGVRDMAYAPTFWDTIDSNIIGSLVYAVGVYFNIYILVPELLLKKRKLAYTLSVVLLVLVVAVVTAQAFALYYQRVHMDTSKFFASIQGIANTGGDFLVVYGLATCLYFINEWYIKERKLRELETQNLKAELDLLKGQINPHFLFNALNSVHVLIRKNPEKARSTLEKFSELLSHQIYEVNKELVSLKDEVENLANFIELQKLRFEDLTKISWKVNGDLKDKQIAPMLFLNFVENAFKYGVAPEDQPVKVDILLHVSAQLVTFSCINSVTDIAEEGNTLGVGLANVRRRLEILYPKKHSLEIEQQNGTYSVHLELNLHEN